METRFKDEHAMVCVKDCEHLYFARVYSPKNLFPWVSCSIARNECKRMWVDVNDDLITDVKSWLKRME